MTQTFIAVALLTIAAFALWGRRCASGHKPPAEFVDHGDGTYTLYPGVDYDPRLACVRCGVELPRNGLPR